MLRHDENWRKVAPAARELITRDTLSSLACTRVQYAAATRGNIFLIILPRDVTRLERNSARVRASRKLLFITSLCIISSSLYERAYRRKRVKEFPQTAARLPRTSRRNWNVCRIYGDLKLICAAGSTSFDENIIKQSAIRTIRRRVRASFLTMIVYMDSPFHREDALSSL